MLRLDFAQSCSRGRLGLSLCWRECVVDPKPLASSCIFNAPMSVHAGVFCIRSHVCSSVLF